MRDLGFRRSGIAPLNTAKKALVFQHTGRLLTQIPHKNEAVSTAHPMGGMTTTFDSTMQIGRGILLRYPDG